jgi:membrane dipeptidase
MIDRREFLAAAGAALLSAPAALGAEPGYPAAAYRRATVIDALGGPGGLEPSADRDGHWSDAEVADARASGVTEVNLTVNVPGNAPGRFDAAIEGIAHADAEIARHPDVFQKIERGADLAAAKAGGRVGLIYGFQDTAMIEGDLGRVALFQSLGVRIMQPTYNRRNALGDGCLEPNDGGLSTLGHEFVAELNARRILLDLSHAGVRTIDQGIAASKRPPAITHTGCRALVDLPRNTGDAALKALADKGGVAGIYFMCYLRYLEQPHREDLIRHLEHAVDVAGEDHVGIGTDGNLSPLRADAAFRAAFHAEIAARIKAGISAPGESPDVINMIPEYNSTDRFRLLADDLAKRGWREARIEKVLGGNFARLFTEVWG